MCRELIIERWALTKCGYNPLQSKFLVRWYKVVGPVSCALEMTVHPTTEDTLGNCVPLQAPRTPRIGGIPGDNSLRSFEDLRKMWGSVPIRTETVIFDVILTNRVP